MSFNRKAPPMYVENADLSRLKPYQLRMIADGLGIINRVNAQKNMAQMAEVLKEAVDANPQRAQRMYDICVLGKIDPAASNALDPNVETRMYEVLNGIIVKHRETLGETATQKVAEAALAIKTSLRDELNKAIREVAESTRPIIIKDASKTKKVNGVLPPEFERMVKLASARIPILLVGPAGCGKTYLCEKLGEALSLDTSDQSCSEGMSESVFNGYLLPTGERGKFEHHTSPFMDRYEKGGVMLLDEMDAGDPNLFTYINKAVANSSYTVPQRYTKPVIKKHKDFVLVAAANTFGAGADAMYVGRNQLDAATLDRFKVGTIYMDYSREVEQSLAPAELCEWAWAIRDKIRASKLRRIMSTRVIKDLATMTDLYGWTRKDWEDAYFTGWTDAELKLVRQAA